MTGSVSVSALVLRKADWRDYDRMVTLLTAEKGRVDAVVRGCRRPKSELISASEPFMAGQAQLYRAGGHVSVTAFRPTEAFLPLREDMDRLTLAAQWLRTLERVSLQDAPQGDILMLALDALSYLSYSGLDPRQVDFMFTVKLSRLLGMLPDFSRCGICQKTYEQTPLGYLPLEGCVCPACRPGARILPEGALRILMKAPLRPFRAVEKLTGHPDLPEAEAAAQVLLEMK